MATAHDIARAAVARWREVRGRTKSLADWCQSYAGYYCLWVGFDREGWIVYESAREAYEASTIVSKNPATAPPGAMHWFNVTRDGHVGLALGDGLMAHTSAAGDTIENLGNHAKISRVSSYFPQQYLGWSRSNGRNPSLVDIVTASTNTRPLEGLTAMPTLFRNKKTGEYALAGDAPGTSANWQPYQKGTDGVRVLRANLGAPIELEPHAYENRRVRYLEPLRIAFDGELLPSATGSVVGLDTEAIATAVVDEQHRRLKE